MSNLTDKKLSRRNVIRVAIATAPIIATLPTGAALARSSNVITAATAADAIDSKGRTLCLDVRSGTVDASGTTLDLGQPAHGSLTAIKQRDYRTDDQWSSPTISEASMCKKGGTYNYWSNGWRNVNVPRGLTVSATALASFAGGIYTTEV